MSEECPYISRAAAMELLGYKSQSSMWRLEHARLLKPVGGTKRIKRYRRVDVIALIEGKVATAPRGGLR